MKEKVLRIVALIWLFMSAGSIAYSQCAMCKATAETATDEFGNPISGGINSGILYMMGAPYLLLGIVAWVFFRKRISGFLNDLRDIHP
jgi:LPXTG-motif cell wall-anchored protein